MENTEKAIAWKDRGNSLAKKGHYQGALSCYNTGLGIDPIDTDILHNKSLVLAKLGKLEESKQCEKQVVVISELNLPLKYIEFKKILDDNEAQRGKPYKGFIDINSTFYRLFGKEWKVHKNDEFGTRLLLNLQEYLKKYDVLIHIPDLRQYIETLVIAEGYDEFKLNLNYNLNRSDYWNVINFYKHYQDNYQEYIRHYQNLLKEYQGKIVLSEEDIISQINQFLISLPFFALDDNCLLLSRYVTKYKRDFTEINFLTFFNLLKLKGFEGNHDVLGYFIILELDKQEFKEYYEKFSKQLLMNNANSIEEYIKNYSAFLKLHENSTINYQEYFMIFLRDNEIVINPEDLEKKIDQEKLRQFEENLLGNTEKKVITIDNIDRMSGEDFELVLKKIFEKKGYYVQTTSITGDQGADLIVKGFGEIIAVQAKNYTSNVGNGAIQEVTASIKHYNANRGLVVTSSGFTISAVELAKSNEIELWDRETISKLLEAYPIRTDDI